MKGQNNYELQNVLDKLNAENDTNLSQQVYIFDTNKFNSLLPGENEKIFEKCGILMPDEGRDTNNALAVVVLSDYEELDNTPKVQLLELRAFYKQTLAVDIPMVYYTDYNEDPNEPKYKIWNPSVKELEEIRSDLKFTRSGRFELNPISPNINQARMTKLRDIVDNEIVFIQNSELKKASDNIIQPPFVLEKEPIVEKQIVQPAQKLAQVNYMDDNAIVIQNFKDLFKNLPDDEAKEKLSEAVTDYIAPVKLTKLIAMHLSFNEFFNGIIEAIDDVEEIKEILNTMTVPSNALPKMAEQKVKIVEEFDYIPEMLDQEADPLEEFYNYFKDNTPDEAHQSLLDLLPEIEDEMPPARFDELKKFLANIPASLNEMLNEVVRIIDNIAIIKQINAILTNKSLDNQEADIYNMPQNKAVSKEEDSEEFQDFEDSSEEEHEPENNVQVESKGLLGSVMGSIYKAASVINPWKSKAENIPIPLEVFNAENLDIADKFITSQNNDLGRIAEVIEYGADAILEEDTKAKLLLSVFALVGQDSAAIDYTLLKNNIAEVMQTNPSFKEHILYNSSESLER